ncbi:MAG: hypothetical protein ACR2GZ_08095 [Solirubrobacteraceae bacterium]
MPPEAERFPWTQAGVGEDGDERRVELAPYFDQVGAHRLDCLWHERAHDTRPPLARLSDRAGRVGVETAPLDGALQDALEHHERLAGCRLAHASSRHLGTQLADPLGRKGP